ncbi:invasin domain 3-containing protein, partial [Erwinia persicina]|uniref:invasin domain 3-containing protein n=1 Tax=Erwinia persicina TaxID=55211 RepID=UPI003C12BD2B
MSAVVPASPGAPADGTVDAVTVTVKDANGNRVGNAAVSLSATNGATLQESVTTDAQGQATAPLSSKKAGAVKVTAKVAGGKDAGQTATVTFTAGAPAQAASGVKTDKASYAAGSDMTVTVTLKDANGNPVAGQAALLTAEAVTVANASLSGSWKENGAGTYAAGYTAITAGTGLKAVLKLPGWSQGSDSAAYAITADISTAKVSAVVPASPGAPADGTVDAVTVTVKDANGNRVGNAAVSLSATNGATLKESVTTDAQGQATAPLSSKKAGAVKVTAKVAGGKDAGQTATVTFTAGAPAQAASGVKTDKASYAAGSDMTVTVTLKDANGNPVAGQASLLTAEAVTVANASLSGSWKENGAGIYTAGYTAITAGTGLKAGVKLPGWSKGSDSAAYVITAGAPAQAASGVKTDKASYAAGSDMTVTVTLKDANGNPVAGQATSLTAEAVTVANATLSGRWTDNQ